MSLPVNLFAMMNVMGSASYESVRAHGNVRDLVADSGRAPVQGHHNGHGHVVADLHPVRPASGRLPAPVWIAILLPACVPCTWSRPDIARRYSCVNVGSNARTHSEADARTHSGTHSEADARTHPEANARTDTRTHARTHSGTHSRTDTGADSGTHSSTHSRTNSRTDTGADSGTHSGTDGRTDIRTDTRAYTCTYTRADTCTDARAHARATNRRAQHTRTGGHARTRTRYCCACFDARIFGSGPANVDIGSWRRGSAVAQRTPAVAPCMVGPVADVKTFGSAPPRPAWPFRPGPRCGRCRR